MNIVDLISLERIAVDADLASKKRSLETLSELLTRNADTLSANTVFEKLISRERLGSTGLGRGVALPHARIEGSSEALGAFIKLQSGVDFDAFDKQPVDLMFALVVPEHFTDEHLQILSSLAELFSDQTLCERLRGAETPEQIHQMLLDWQATRNPS
ncbi:PTS IIA-like nitrogen regulatory protein PtsN [Alkalilimnicola sp. S0819]|uniref:PTS IIA-like nitrogen regulatory protein PtsN n=1 Tax=Alkalilimnicola sp. S0819 TaxID=2613922 RepID=UPI001261EACE|nr:PTS IIA-like nitrogen regulatory protein PtsN [Alkalilimnicola sp. S0819]KAB7623820.1 PTS IIA-like nitrogen regulatory protein PtsN [Alkalilimnicola sp. S0819]MPQ16694.1 PTS IIA-like nitrogen regulatory protein PtsN [Alkalilimnicola sp. S0819]